MSRCAAIFVKLGEWLSESKYTLSFLNPLNLPKPRNTFVQMFERVFVILLLIAGQAVTCPGAPFPLNDGAGYFAFSPSARDIHRKILDLRFSEAQAGLETLKRQEPGNLIALFLENYIDVLTVVCGDRRADYHRLVKNMNGRLSALARGDARSPYFLYTQGEIRLQWALLRGRYGDYLSSFQEVRRAYDLLLENRRRHPDFVANRKSLGLLHALVGNVPPEYRWALKTLGGLSGTVEQGMAELESVLTYSQTHDFPFAAETLVTCAFLQLHLKNDKTTAWQTLRAGGLHPQNSPLATFVMAALAMRTGRNDEAVRLLEQCPGGPAFHPFPYRYYQLGIAKLNRLDPDANRPLETFLQIFKGESGQKEACQKLAWFHLLAGDPVACKAWMQQVKTRGNDRSEPDKAALREARSGEMPDVRLLKARLLFDGGYYRRAYELLKNAEAAYSGTGKKSIEYAYRMGRIAHELGDTAAAIRFYTHTIDAGAKQPWYFACNAALQLGLLYEQRKDFVSANAAFKRCLNLRPEEYAGSLHARAKAGLARLK